MGFCQEKRLHLKQPCDEQGTVVELEYDTPAYAVNDLLGLDETLHKKVEVYLPYGYDETKQYNILYLLHGTEGETDGPMEEFWLKQWGDTTLPVLDNMIKQGLWDWKIEETCRLRVEGSILTRGRESVSGDSTWMGRSSCREAERPLHWQRRRRW